MLPPFSCRSSVLRHTALKYRLGIAYIYQIQALGRCRGAGGTAVARGYNGCKIFHTQFSAPYIQQGAHKGTHHIAQKARSEEHTSELQSRPHLVCRLLLEKKKKK